MVHDRIPICTGGQQRCCVVAWPVYVCVGYLDGGGVRDKTESEISFVPAGSAPTFLLPCCQFYQSHARTQTEIRISRDPLFPYIRVLLRRIYRTEPRPLASLYSYGWSHFGHDLSPLPPDARVLDFSPLPRAAGNWTWTRCKPFRPCIFQPFCAWIAFLFSFSRVVHV